MPALNLPLAQKITAVLWPSFLSAGVATILLTTAIDPHEIQVCFGGPELSRLGFYSISFFCLWLLMAMSSFVTSYYLLSQVRGDDSVNKPIPREGQ